MNKYSITYQKYGRGDSQVCTTSFMAPNDKAAALVASPHICYGCGRFDIDELDEEDIQDLKDMSTEDIIENFNYEDGGDYIFSLKNETTGEVLFTDDMAAECRDDDVEFTEEMFGNILCFIVHPKHPDVKVAKRDIVCYKEGYNVGTTFMSLYWQFDYKFGKIYSQRKKEWPQVESVLEFEELCIQKGFHSFSDKRKLHSNYDAHVRCIIPKGSKYFYNPDDKEYVSNQIIVQEFIK